MLLNGTRQICPVNKTVESGRGAKYIIELAAERLGDGLPYSTVDYYYVGELAPRVAVSNVRCG